MTYHRKPGVKPRKVILKEGDPRVFRIFPINPLHLICCDCGSTHDYTFSIVDGRISFTCKLNKSRTRLQRKKGRHPFVPRSHG